MLLTAFVDQASKEDYDIIESNIYLLCDNTVVIILSTNLILHSRAKHIEIKHHFIRDYVQKGILDLKFISTENQLTDIFTKLLLEDKFIYIKNLLEELHIIGLKGWNASI
ncbi:Copia protein, partial [Mucuna pruriens]